MELEKDGTKDSQLVRLLDETLVKLHIKEHVRAYLLDNASTSLGRAEQLLVEIEELKRRKENLENMIEEQKVWR